MSDLAAEMKKLLLGAIADINAAQERAIREATEDMERVARVLVHVKSGRLKESTKGRLASQPKTGKFVGEVTAKTPYTHLVEFGTKTSKAYPFLAPAFEAGAERAEALTIRYVNEVISKLGSGGNG